MYQQHIKDLKNFASRTRIPTQLKRFIYNRKISARIITMDKEIEFKTVAKTHGKDFFNEVSKNLAMHEIWFFGLMFLDENGDEVWIDDSKKTLKDLKSNVLKLHYRVKYYPEDIGEELIEDNTIRYFFLQVRADILNETIYCPPDTSVLLASYSCQARFGDYHVDMHNTEFLGNQKLLPKTIYAQHKMSPEEFHEAILNLWVKHKGMMKEDAMLEYLKLAQNLEMYGIRYFEITNKKGTELVLGVHAIGLNVYKPTDRMNPIIMFPWSEIKNINYRDRKFIIKSLDKKSTDFIFFTSAPKINKRIMNLGVGNHYLYVRRRKTPSLEVIQMKTKAMEQRKMLLEQRSKLQTEITAREEAEKREKRYQEQIKALKEEMERHKSNLLEAQDTIQKLKDQLLLLQMAKEELEKQQNELRNMMIKLEESKNMEAAERQKLEEEIMNKQDEVRRIQEEVETKNQETLRLQEEVERARQIEEEGRSATDPGGGGNEESGNVTSPTLLDRRNLRAQQIADAARQEEQRELESLPEDSKDDLPELAAVNEQLKEQLKLLQQKLEQSRDETKETELDKIHRENIRDGRDKYKTLAEIRKGNTVRRVDLFENL
ncbi:FERM N-terminal domain [Popillia japonica]|uniref:FERM N-terminal domain n=1 Tax=Popillia japonica TaxID=7064 RepID=A0AAW1ITR2_POPJA